MPTSLSSPVRVLMVDDEPLALIRMRTLLAAMQQPPALVVGEAISAQAALQLLEQCMADVVFVDIHMPGQDGLEFAHSLRQTQPACQVVFVTAHSDYALHAFDLNATDYLTKPVRRERLQAALLKVNERKALNQPPVEQAGQTVHADTVADVGMPHSPVASLILKERGRVQRVLLEDVVFAQAELKYVTLHLRDGSQSIWSGTIQQLEQDYPHVFLRIHRATLVQKSLLYQCKKRILSDGGEGWFVQMQHSGGEWLPVSRRLVASVRQALAQQIGQEG